MMETAVRAGLYARVSTDDQAREGVSLRAQRESMTAFCRAQGWIPLDTYLDDGYSGSSLDRPALTRLRRDVADGRLDLVLVWRLDRLTRRVVDLHTLLEEFARHRVGFRSVTEVFDTTSAMGRLFLTLVAAMAQWERENLVERVSWGMAQVAQEGRWHGGGHVPFGYDYRDGRLEVNPVEAATYRLMVDLYLVQGWGYEKIAQWLNGDNPEGRLYPPKEADRWRYTSVRQVLRNPLYKGYVRNRDKLHKGQHEPLIDAVTWDALQSQSTVRSGSQAPKHASFLSGILRCSECGSRMRSKRQWANWPRQPKRYHRNYVCYSYLGAPSHLVTGPCRAGYRHGPKLDQEVIHRLSALAADPDVLDRVIEEELRRAQPERENLARERERIVRALADVERRLRQYLDAFEAGSIAASVVGERMDELGKAKEELRQQLRAVTEREQRVERQRIQADTIRARLTSFGAAMDRLTEAERWQIIHTLIREIWVDAAGTIQRIEWRLS